MSELRLVDLIYRWRISEAIDRMNKKLDNEFYVTDLVYCPLKYHYQKKYRELAISSAINPVTVLGELAHYGVEKLLVEILGANNVKVEVEFERDLTVDSSMYIVKGRVDAIVGDYIVEIKTGHSDISIPQSHHVLQTRIYLWLTGFRKALLLYITRNRMAEFLIDKPASDGEMTDLIRGIITGSPAPKYPWECSYCTYATLCPWKKASD